jgi:toxin ParE1/3/4
MMRAVFNRLADHEFSEAAEHYEGKSPGLGFRFSEEVRHAIILLTRHPEAAPKIHGSIRRLVLPKFPYSLIYRPREDQSLIRILAIAHHKRKPAYWIRRR